MPINYDVEYPKLQRKVQELERKLERVKGLPRYDEREATFGLTGETGLARDDTGEWVRYDELQAIINGDES